MLHTNTRAFLFAPAATIPAGVFALAQGGSHVVTGGCDGGVCVFDATDGHLQHSLKEHSAEVVGQHTCLLFACVCCCCPWLSLWEAWWRLATF